MTHRLDIHIRQGETWSQTYVHTVDGSPVDLSAYTGEMDIRAGYESGLEFTLTTEDGGMSLAADGTVTLSISAADTATIAGDLSFFIFTNPKARADREVEFIYSANVTSPGGVVTRILEGRAFVTRQVTA